MTYNHELDMERLYEMYSQGIHSVHNTHNVGHIEVLGPNIPQTVPIRPPLPTPPSPSPEPPSEHHNNHHHKNKPWDTFKNGVDTFRKGFEEGGKVLADVADPYKDHQSGGLDIHTGK